MSAYEDAVESTGIQVGSWAELCVRRVLAALAPDDDSAVIVLSGGKVVELAAAHRVVAAGNGEELEDINDIAAHERYRNDWEGRVVEQVSLTPRVGDRVLLRDGFGITRAGNVTHIEHGDTAEVLTDGGSAYLYNLDSLTVVDREPVEWPEGWADHGGFDAVRFYGKDRVGGVSMTRGDLEHILATGPDMLARWDDLKGAS